MEFIGYLSDLLHCQYLSDLHYITITQQQADKILSCPEERFPLKDYNEAAHYILDSTENFSTIIEAKQAIIQRLLLQSPRPAS